MDNFFADEVWGKVGERTCLRCHNFKGDASDSKFLLRDTSSDKPNRAAAMRHNREAFQRVAAATEDGQSLLLSKITGGLDHGGGDVLKADSTGYRILNRFVRRISGKPDDGPAIDDYDAPPFFDGIEMISPRRLVRRLTLSLVGRLPGKLDSLAYPTFAALVAACKGSEVPLAFLTFGNYSATGNIVPMAHVPYLNSLTRLANADGVHGNARSPYHDDFVTDRIERALEEQMQARVSEVRLPRVERSQSMLYAAQVNSKALQRVTPYIPKSSPKERLSQQADIALASFKAGVCVSANLSIGQFDSHANNDPDQMKLIPEFLSGIDYLVTKSDELKIRDKLVVIIQSEMGRTPNYNQGNGKDHWSIGSIMFMGHGIQGNRVIGATDEKQFLVPVNPKTLSCDEENGIRVRPEHIHESLRQFAGIDKHAFSEQFPLKVPDNEQLHGMLKPA